MKIVEVIAVIVSAVVIVAIPKQLTEWENGQNNRAFDQLIRLDDILRQGSNQKITTAIIRNKPILIENGGKFTNQELDEYIDNLYSIYDANLKGIISLNDVYRWFSGVLTRTVSNQEVVIHLQNIRADNPDYYAGFEDFVKEIDLNNKMGRKVLGASTLACISNLQFWPVILIGITFSVFYACKAVEIFQNTDLQNTTASYTRSWWIHQGWIHFIGSMVGWLAVYMLLIDFAYKDWPIRIQDLSLAHFGVVVFALLGIMGFLPLVIWNLSKTIYSLPNKIK